MALSINSFNLEQIRGALSLGLNTNTLSALVGDGSENIFPGDAVKLLSTSKALPLVTRCTNNDDTIFGLAQHNIKNICFETSQPLELSKDSNCIVLEAGEAITAGENVALDIQTAGHRVVKFTPTRTHVGTAFDSATAAGDLIRVIVGEQTKFEYLTTNQRVLGTLDLAFGYSVARAEAAGALAIGDAVEVASNAGLDPMVTKANAVGDDIFGYVMRGDKATYADDDRVYLAQSGSVIVLTASGAITRGAVVCLSTTTGQVTPSTGSSTIVGVAIDGATNANDLIRVRLEAPSVRTAS